MVKGSSFIFLTPLTYTEFGQLLDAYYEERSSMAVHKLMKQFKEKSETYEQKIPSLDFSLDREWQTNGIRWVKFEVANGFSHVLSHIEGEVTEFELPEYLKEHIAKRKPVMITKWW